MRQLTENRIAKHSGSIRTLLEIVKDIEKEIDLERAQWFEIQMSCKHKFPKEKKRSYMGKGICFICGYNDY